MKKWISTDQKFELLDIQLASIIDELEMIMGMRCEECGKEPLMCDCFVEEAVVSDIETIEPGKE